MQRQQACCLLANAELDDLAVGWLIDVTRQRLSCSSYLVNDSSWV